MLKSQVIITTSKKIKNLCLGIRKTCPSNMPWRAKKIYINTFFHPIKNQLKKNQMQHKTLQVCFPTLEYLLKVNI